MLFNRLQMMQTGHTHTHTCMHTLFLCVYAHTGDVPLQQWRYALCRFQVSWYPRVQFKVRVFRAFSDWDCPCCPIYTRTFVGRCHKHGAASAKRAYIKAYAAQRRNV